MPAGADQRGCLRGAKRQARRERRQEVRGQRQRRSHIAMPPVPSPSLPFLTRTMLSFEHGLAFTLNIRTQADVTLDLLIQGMTREGTFTFKHTTASTSIVTSADFRIPYIPIYLTVTQAINSGFQGEIFCAVNLQAGSNIIQELISGTVYGDKALTWPSNPAADSRPNGGALALRLSANPAAGAELSLDVPIGEVWRVQSVAFQLVTSATV